MWGVLKNAAAAGLSKVDELATQGLASATQLLEKLDGEFEETDESVEEEGTADIDEEGEVKTEEIEEKPKVITKRSSSAHDDTDENSKEEAEESGSINIGTSRYETRSRRRNSNPSITSEPSDDKDNKKALKKLQAKLAEVEASLAESQGECTKERAKTLKKKDEDVAHTLAEKDKTISDLQTKAKQKDADLARLEEEQLTRFAEIGSMTSELEKLRREAAASANTIAELRTQLTQPRAEESGSAEMMRALQEKCALMKQQKASLVQERDKFLKKVEELTALTQERDALLPKAEELSALKKERDMLSRKVKDLLNANTGLQTQLAEAVKTSEATAAAAAASEGVQQKDSESKLKNEAEIKRLSTELDQLTEQLAASNASVAALQASVAEKDRQLELQAKEAETALQTQLAQVTEVIEFAAQQKEELLSAELEKVKTELSANAAAFAALQVEMSSKSKELAAVQEERETSIQRLEQELTDARAAVERLEQELVESKEGQEAGGRRVADKLTKKMKKLEQERIEMLGQIAQLQKQLQEQIQVNADAALATEVKAAAPTVDPSAIIELEERVAALQHERDELQGKLDKALRVQQLKAEVASVRSLQQEFRQDVEQQLGDFVQQLKETSFSLAQALAASDTKPAAGMSEEHSSSPQQSETETLLQAKVLELEATITSNVTEITTLQQASQTLSAQLAELTAERDQLAVKVEQLELTVSTSHNTSAVLETNNAKLESQVNDLTRELKVAQEELTRLQVDNDELSKQLVDLQLASTSNEDETDALKDACANLRAQVAELQASLKESSAISAEAESLRRANEETLQQVNDLKTEAAGAVERAASAEARVEQLEASLQQRVIDDTVLRDTNKELAAELKHASTKMADLEKMIVSLQSQVASAESTKASELESLRGHIYTLKLDLEGLNKIYLEKEKELSATKDQLSALQSQAAGAAQGETHIASLKQSLAAAVRRAEEAEVALRTLEEKAEEKKHRDLEALRHHNDLYSALQLEKLQSERALTEANSELVQQIEYLKASLGEATKAADSAALEATTLKSQLVELQSSSASGPSGSQNDRAQTAAVRRGSFKSASHDKFDTPDGASPSYVMVDAESSGAPSERRVDTSKLEQELAQCLAQLSEARAELKLWALRAEGAEEAAKSLQTDAAAMQEQLKSVQTLVGELQQERRRLEGENQQLERTLSHSLHSLPGFTRERPARGDRSSGSEGESDAVGDVELGDLKAELYDYWESEKKGEAGVLPVFVQLWDILRYRAPWMLRYVGERPPRLGLVGQVALIYFLFLHLALWWETGKRCPLPIVSN